MSSWMRIQSGELVNLAHLKRIRVMAGYEQTNPEQTVPTPGQLPNHWIISGTDALACFGDEGKDLILFVANTADEAEAYLDNITLLLAPLMPIAVQVPTTNGGEVN